MSGPDSGTVFLPSSGGALGTNDCSATFPKAKADRSYTAVITAYDDAGNASMPSAPIAFKFKHAAGCALAGAPSPSGIAELFGAALLLLWLRRGARATAAASR